MALRAEPRPATDYRISFHPDEPYDPRKVSRLSHTFHQHPSLGLDRLRALALRFQAEGRKQVKFVDRGARTQDPLKLYSEDPEGLSLDEVFDRIEEPGSWVSLYNVATDPEYRELVDEVMACMAPHLASRDPGAFESDGFIFISSAPSATPFHIDRENNFFLQIHGRKRMSVWDPSDRQVVPEDEIEKKIGMGTASTVRFEDRFWERAAFNAELGPGEGVYMPSTAGHTTNTEALPSGEDDTYSVSIGVVYYTRATRRAAYVYALNHRLRKMGVEPHPPYESPLRDALKFPGARGFVWARQILKGFELPPGM